MVCGHGYVSNPPSRQAQCARGTVTNCGQIQYEPQSVEAVKGLRSCNGGIAMWAPLADESKAWVATSVGTSVTFTWTLTAAHATASYEYYIGSTRVGYFVGGPDPRVHTVNLAGYTGRQKVLAIWNIGDTADAFYNCVDLIVGGSSSGGTTTPTTTPTTTTPTTTTTTTTTTCTPSSYTVVSGDTLSQISLSKGITLAALLAANPQVTNANLIYIGQVLSVPCATTTTARRSRAAALNVTDDSLGFTEPDAEVDSTGNEPALEMVAAASSSSTAVAGDASHTDTTTTSNAADASANANAASAVNRAPHAIWQLLLVSSVVLGWRAARL
jgi:chitin-binding protein